MYPKNIIKPSLRLILYPVRISVKKSKVKTIKAGISKFNIKGSMLIGLIIATSPKTKKILQILLPMILPTLMLGILLIDAVKEVASSGKDVPRANTVIPIIQGLRPNTPAKPTPPLIIISAPKITPAKENKIIRVKEIN